MHVSFAGLLFLTACGGGLGGGTKWMEESRSWDEPPAVMAPQSGPRGVPPTARTIGANAPPEDGTGGGGKVLGIYRNTYYDFPHERDHVGATVSLMSASCAEIAKVPRGFHDAVCVQGSGSLAKGGTVSFAKRDCACAETCPRTGQKICFEELDVSQFPYGRGANGTPITPFRTVAADTSLLPMGTVPTFPSSTA